MMMRDEGHVEVDGTASGASQVAHMAPILFTARAPERPTQGSPRNTQRSKWKHTLPRHDGPTPAHSMQALPHNRRPAPRGKLKDLYQDAQS